MRYAIFALTLLIAAMPAAACDSSLGNCEVIGRIF